MKQELFKITPQNYFNSKGVKIDTFEIVLIRFSYASFTTSIQAYVEKRNTQNQLLAPGFNITIETPESWGTDDMEAIKAFAAHPDVDCEILDFWKEPKTEE